MMFLNRSELRDLTSFPSWRLVKIKSQPLPRWPFRAFILIQGLLIFFGAFSWRPWLRLGRLGGAINAFVTMTETVGNYNFFAPKVNAQVFVQVHAAGPPPLDYVVGSDLSQEAALRLLATERDFAYYKNIPLLLELESRQFFERHPEYNTVVVTYGYYRAPSLRAWRSGERVSMQKSLEMTFQRSD
jgi:hypothetical protein